MSGYYFEALPVHPQPEQLEFLTSYLTRLAETNGIPSVYELFRLCFPAGRSKFTFNTGDYPPRSLGMLPTVAVCPEPTLLATTFYYLARKFGRRTEPQPLSQFMSGTLSATLRYCPECLAEHDYYSLLWRFVDLEGCPDHGGRLLDHCPSCHQPIPLLSQPPSLGICPTCGHDLRTGQSERLGGSARQTAQEYAQDLAFLLSPLATEPADRAMVEFMGEQFTRWRQVRRLKMADVADYTEQISRTIYFIEKGSERRSTKLQWYLSYAELLKVRFRTMFETPLPIQSEPTFEDRIVDKVEQAIARLEQSGELVTQRAICRQQGICGKAFTQYPRVRALWQASQARWRQKREAELIQQIHDTAERAFKEAGKPVSQKALCHQLGWTADGLKRYPPLKAALKQVAKQMELQYEEKLLLQVRQALAELEAQGVCVTKRAISTKVGVPIRTMMRRPKVHRLVVEQVVDRQPEHLANQRQQREQAMVEHVQQTITALRAAGQPVTRKAVCQQVKWGRSTLDKYPRVQSLLKAVTLAKAQHE